MRMLRTAVLLYLLCPVAVYTQGVGGISPRAFGDKSVRAPVATLALLPVTSNVVNDTRMVLDELVWYVWDGDSWNPAGGGAGSDDQTASEVPITDTGDFYNGSDVESALQQVGGDVRWTDARTPLLHTHTSAGITDFTSAVQGIGDARYTLLGHTHTSTSVTDFTSATQAVGDVRYSLLGHVHTSSSVTDFTTAVQSVGDARYSLLSHTHLLQDLGGAVTDLQVPNDITVDLAALATIATLATTATTANSGDTATGFFSFGTVEASRLPNLSDMNGAVTDGQVPDTITISGTAGRCARYDVSGNLVPSSGDCPNGDTTGSSTVLPSDLPSLLVWLKADSLSLSDGNSVSTWTDSSGTSHDFTESSASVKPTYHTNKVNGKPAVTFDGGDCLTNSSVALSTFSVFAVFHSTSGSGSGVLYEHSPNTNSNDGGYLNSGGNNAANVKRGGTASQRDFGCASCGTGASAVRFDWGNDDMWHTVLHSFGGTHQTHKIVPDGAFFSQQYANTSSLSSTSTVTSEMNIGCRDEASFFFTGDIAEFIMYTPQLTKVQERQVVAYLQDKYNL